MIHAMFLFNCNHKLDPYFVLVYFLVQKFMTRCRKLVGMLGCASMADVHVPRGSTRTLASSSHVGKASSSSHAASSYRIFEEAEGEYDEEE